MSGATATADLPPPSRSGHLLALVRKLWNYGMQLSASLRQHPPTTDDGRAHLENTFGISNVMVILTRIALGMKRARFLEEKIARAAAQIDAGSQPEAAPSPGTPRARGLRAPSAHREPPPDDETLALVLRLPTISHIAREVLRQPIGEVLADICRDLGITDGHPLWDELHAAIAEFGGTIVNRDKSKLNEVFPTTRVNQPPKAKPEASPEPTGTGPPLPAAA
jgi:hypothetical protein